MKKNKKNKKKMSKLKKFTILLVLLLIVVASAYIYLNYFKNDNSVKQKTKIVDKIDNFDYTISDTDTKLFKEVDDILKYHIDIRHIRGGESTKKKYKKII